MGDWPVGGNYPCTIHPYSWESMGPFIAHVQGTVLPSIASAVWPTANKAMYMPFWLAQPIIVVKLFCLNGAAVSGNVDMGIYDAAGTKIVSTGSTAQAGISVIQEFDIADTVVGPGLFYLAIALDNTTGTIYRGFFLSLPVASLAGMAHQLTAFPLPATATFAAVATNTTIPICALTTRSVI